MEQVEVHINKPERLTTCNSRRKIGSDPNHSPEFEFWMTRNPSFPQPTLLSADELFSGGVLLPLHNIQPPFPEDPPDPIGQKTDPEQEASGSGRVDPEPEPGPKLSGSKRWKDIFKKSEKKEENSCREKKKEKRRVGGGGGGNGGVGGAAAELNINIWPFSRSRSAGNGGSRSRVITGGSGYPTRKVSSAPCSRSNSAGESKSRKWPSSPARNGVHLGRASPVWQVRPKGVRKEDKIEKGVKKEDKFEKVVKKEDKLEKGVKKEGFESRRKVTSAAVGSGGGGGATKARVLNLNVPMCIGYRNQLGCRSDENSAISLAAVAGGDGGGGGQSGGTVNGGEGVRGSSNLFSIKNLFTKKVY